MFHRAKSFSTAALALAAACLASVPAAHAFSVTFQSSATIEAGSPFEVDVIIDEVFAHAPFDNSSEALTGFGFDVVLDAPSLAAFTGAAPGPEFVASGLGSPGVSAFAATGDLTKANGITSLLLATLSFDALAPGLLTLSLATPDFGDFLSNQGLFYAVGGTGDLTSQTTLDIAPRVPAPAPLLLIGVGLFPLAARHGVRWLRLRRA
jgi:hypothetical protein